MSSMWQEHQNKTAQGKEPRHPYNLMVILWYFNKNNLNLDISTWAFNYYYYIIIKRCITHFKKLLCLIRLLCFALENTEMLNIRSICFTLYRIKFNFNHKNTLFALENTEMLNIRSICFTSYRIKFNCNYNVLCTSF